MAKNERVISTLVRLQLDKAAAQNLQRGFRNLRSEADAFADHLNRIESEARSGARSLRDVSRESRSISTLETSIRGSADEMRRLRNESERAGSVLARTAAQPAARVDPRLYGDVESRTRSITGAIGYLGGAGFERTANVGAELLGAAEGVGLLKDELPQLVSQLGLSRRRVALLGAEMVILVGAAAVLREEITSLIEANNAGAIATNANIDALRRYNEFITNATTEQLQEERDAATERVNQNRRLKEGLLELRQAFDSLESDGTLSLENLSRGALNAYAALGGNVAGLKDLEQALNDTDLAIQSDTIYLDQLTRAFMDNATAANDAAARQAEVNKRAMEGINQRMALEIEMAQAARDWSSEQARTELENIEIQRAAVQQAKDELLALGLTSDEATAQLKSYDDQLFTLQQRTDELTTTVIPLIEAREREAALVENARTIFGNLLDAGKTAITETSARVTQLKVINQAEKDTAIKTAEDRRRAEARMAEDFALKRMADIEKFNRQQADAERKYYEDRAALLDRLDAVSDDTNQERVKLLKDRNKEAQRLAEDHARKMVQIEQDTRVDVQEAAAQLDATAVLSAQRQGERALKEEDEQYQLQKKRREEDFRDQLDELETQRREKIEAYQQELRDLEQKHREQQRENRIAFDRELSEQDAANQLKLQRMQEDYQLQDKETKDHYQSQREELFAYFDETETAMIGWTDRMAAYQKAVFDRDSVKTPAGNYIQSNVDRTAAIQRALFGGTKGSFSGYYADGGRIRPGEWGIVGERGPEAVFAMSNGAMVAPNYRTTSHTRTVGDISISIYESHNPQATAIEVRNVLAEVLST